MPVLLRNNVTATLATALSATDTGIALTSGHGARFPSLGAGEYFYATLSGPTTGPEIVKVTTRVGDALTVVRAQEGTVGQHFPSGGRIELRVTAASIEDSITDEITSLSFAANSFTGTGAQLIFTLATAAISKNHTLVFIDGVYQNKAGYSISGTTLTFSEAPPLNSAVEVNMLEL
jgi:hypothetical protein